MAKYGMAIDLKRCVGCGACAIACKTENNTDIEKNGKRYNWADFYSKTEGKFSQGNLKHWVFPTLCNHCTDAPCVEVCPANPKALFKTEDGITMLNHDRCIGCGYCINRCPYSDHNVDVAGVQYSVLTRNSAAANTHWFYDDDSEIIAGCTFAPKEIAETVGKRPPHVNEYTDPDTQAVRPKNKTEKCTFCAHRLLDDLEPYCVVSCPAHARMFGDLDDPQSEINSWIADGYVRLKNNKGELITMNDPGGIEPNIYYVGIEGLVGINEAKPSIAPAAMKLFPNPAKDHVSIELEYHDFAMAAIAIFDITGKAVNIEKSGYQLNAGVNRIKIDLPPLKQGTYIVRLAVGQKAFSANLVVMP